MGETKFQNFISIYKVKVVVFSSRIIVITGTEKDLMETEAYLKSRQLFNRSLYASDCEKQNVSMQISHITNFSFHNI